MCLSISDALRKQIMDDNRTCVCTHTIHVWYIHLYLVNSDGKCRCANIYIYHTWIGVYLYSKYDVYIYKYMYPIYLNIIYNKHTRIYRKWLLNGVSPSQTSRKSCEFLTSFRPAKIVMRKPKLGAEKSRSLSNATLEPLVSLRLCS